MQNRFCYNNKAEFVQPKQYANMAQLVEHILGKDEVTSSSLVSSSTKKHTISGVFFLMRAKFFAHICTISLKLCVEPVVCARCLFLQAIPHLRLPSELSRQTSRRYGVPFFVCVPHTVAKTLQAGSSATLEASSCQQFQPLLLPSAALWSILS